MHHFDKKQELNSSETSCDNLGEEIKKMKCNDCRKNVKKIKKLSEIEICKKIYKMKYRLIFYFFLKMDCKNV
jgi:hypothetical protein